MEKCSFYKEKSLENWSPYLDYNNNLFRVFTFTGLQLYMQDIYMLTHSFGYPKMNFRGT